MLVVLKEWNWLTNVAEKDAHCIADSTNSRWVWVKQFEDLSERFLVEIGPDKSCPSNAIGFNVKIVYRKKLKSNLACKN